MSKWNLNKTTDFLQTTMSPLASAALLLAGLDPTEWDVSEGSFRDVLFHIFKSRTDWQGAADQIEDSGGRRKAKYVFPYRDGQTTEDLGRMPQTFRFNILIHGNSYIAGVKQLIEAFDDPTPGVLVHPIRDSLSQSGLPLTTSDDGTTCSEVVVEGYSILHSSEKRKAALFSVTFIEHNFTIGSFKDFNDLIGSFRKALSACLAVFGAISAAIATVLGAIALLQSLSNSFKTAATKYSNDYAKTLVKLNQTFNQPQNVSATVTGTNADIPAFVPVSQGGLVNPDGTFASNTATTTVSASDPFASLPLSILTTPTQSAIALQQAVTEVQALFISAQALVTMLENALGGQGALQFHDEINNIKNSAVLLQNVLNAAVSSSKSIIKDYTVPRLMSLREIAFANGLKPDNAIDLEILNPSIESVNYVVAGTIIKVPIA